MDGTSSLVNPAGLSPEGFVDTLSLVPWFGRLGEPNPRDHEVARIHDWHEWPGPELLDADGLGLRTQVWYEELMAGAGPQGLAVEAFWKRTQEIVIEHARGAVPYDPDEDAWHGPTAAVWYAACVAAAVGCSLLLGREIPSEVKEQWRWLIEGHWPCGYARAPVEGEPIRLMVL